MTFNYDVIVVGGINPRVSIQRIELTANKPNKTDRLPSQAGNIQMPYKSRSMTDVFILLALSIEEEDIRVSILLFL